MLNQWLRTQGLLRSGASQLRIDVLVPSYRCELAYLCPIIDMALAADGTVVSADPQQARRLSVGVVLIADNPEHQAPYEKLRATYGKDRRVRLRMQPFNTGASTARNRCLDESTADWVIFLDDDIQLLPDVNIVRHYADAILRWGRTASGFAGCTDFPVATTPRQRGLHIAGVTVFWDIGSLIGAGEAVPWGVTANLCVRRIEGVRFDPCFPKGGGGEDAAFCVEIQRAAGLPLRGAPSARAAHAYWSGGFPPLSRFWNWGTGDGLLLDQYPDLTYGTALNVSEVLLLHVVAALALCAALAACGMWAAALRCCAVCGVGGIAVLLADLRVTAHRLAKRCKEQAPDDRPMRKAGCSSSMSTVEIAAMALHTELVVWATELGRIWGQAWHSPACAWRNVGRRYMWWGLAHPDVVEQEQQAARMKAGVMGWASAAVMVAAGGALLFAC